MGITKSERSKKELAELNGLKPARVHTIAARKDCTFEEAIEIAKKSKHRDIRVKSNYAHSGDYNARCAPKFSEQIATKYHSMRLV